MAAIARVAVIALGLILAGNCIALAGDLTLKRTAASADTRRFADGLLALRQKRHHADYNPTALFSPADALDAITEAEAATAAFRRVPEDEQSDVLALMMVRLRD